jgi:methylated-DNA-[protein]-cysteine S-methyltransferase
VPGAAYDLFPDPLGTALAVVEGGSLLALGHYDSLEEAEAARVRGWPEAVRDPRDPRDQSDLDTAPLPALRAQLAAYFAGALRSFDLPLAPRGSAFQLQVWEALREIPYGATRSYADIARAVGSPGASRAVGGANHDNPIGVVVPCHRVIGAGGALTGYAGGLARKRFLLELEGALPRSLPFA